MSNASRLEVAEDLPGGDPLAAKLLRLVPQFRRTRSSDMPKNSMSLGSHKVVLLQDISLKNASSQATLEIS